MALTAVTFLLCSFAIMFVFYFESGYRHQLEKTEPLTRGCRFRCMLGPCVFLRKQVTVQVEVSGYVGASESASIRWSGQLLWLRWKFLGVKGKSWRGEEVERI